MAEFKKYKKFIATFLLALYAFIATPVNFWHHHNYFNATASGAADKKATASFSTCADKNTEANCQFCSHQYSTYNNGSNIISAEPLFRATAKEGFYYHSIPSAPFFNFANKGPPVLA